MNFSCRDAASRHQEENIALKKALEVAQKLLGEGISGDHCLLGGKILML